MIQLTYSGTSCTDSPAELDDLRERFDRQHCIRLPGLLDPSVLAFAQRQLEAAPFDELTDLSDDTHQPFAFELKQTTGRAMGLLYLLINDPCFFQVIRRITGCDPVGCFKGRIYRIIPGQGHYDSWHDDVGWHRMVGMSINLSTDIFSGGLFQLRNIRSNDRLDIANQGFGDAILFRIADYLEHQVSEMSGIHPKTALAGWFCSQPDFRRLLHRSTDHAQSGWLMGDHER
jgi:hypothetical protein